MDEAVVTLTGRLLVATPSLLDPNFRQAVVLVLQHDDEGAIGLVLNQPSHVPLAATVAAWDSVAAPPDVVFVGGPVEQGGVLGLAEVRDVPADADAWQPVVGTLGVVDLTRTPLDVPVDRVRLFTGYAGWGAGQLEAEIAAGSWYLVEADVADAFSDTPDRLWREVLARQGGVYRTIPPDPSLN